MTLAEKLGQLTMTAAIYAVTGPVIAGDSTDSIRDGTLGNLLNMVGADHCHEMQRLAVEGSRLRHPAAHRPRHHPWPSHPVPGASGRGGGVRSAAWAQTAREAALEARADGLAHDFRSDARCLPRSALGPRRGGTWRGSLARSTHGARPRCAASRATNLSAAESLAACAKHFCAYGPVTAGREYAAVDISERTLHEVHLPPFAAAIAAGVATVMPSFTDLAGIPMTVHVGLLRGWLREKHGFDGVIVSDYNAIGELINHGVAADLVEAATLALKAGVDIDMMSDAYRRGLPDGAGARVGHHGGNRCGRAPGAHAQGAARSF